MAVVTFMSYDGEQHEAPLEEGSSLMQVATNNAIPGIDADCGGEAACGTCHVVVDPSWATNFTSSLPAELPTSAAGSATSWVLKSDAASPTSSTSATCCPFTTIAKRLPASARANVSRSNFPSRFGSFSW